jgi:hypothetical protein
MKVHLIVLAVLLLPFSSFAQKEKREKKDPWTSTELWIPVPINRQLWHDKIDKIQLAADEFDHTKDGRITVKGDTASSDKLTDALLRHVDQLQQIIENLPLDHFKKITYITYLTVEPSEDEIENYIQTFKNTILKNNANDLLIFGRKAQTLDNSKLPENIRSIDNLKDFLYTL